MSTPMYDMPEHFPMPVTKDGEGPADVLETVEFHCWCGEESCTKFRITAEQFKSAVDYLSTKDVGLHSFIDTDGYTSTAIHSPAESAQRAVYWMAFAGWIFKELPQ